jgi:hypothetical protein
VTRREVDVVRIHFKKERFMGLNYFKMLSAALNGARRRTGGSSDKWL